MLWITLLLFSSKICAKIPEVVVLPLVPVILIKALSIYRCVYFKKSGQIFNATKPAKDVAGRLSNFNPIYANFDINKAMN